MTRLLSILCFLCVLLLNRAEAQTIYVSQSGDGSQNGTSIGNAYALTWFTTSGNWGNSAGQVGPGVTVMLEGNIGGTFSILGSGTSGNPITIKFDTGATVSAATYTSGMAPIMATAEKYFTIDGGGTNNGAIFCTANGYGLANANTCNGIILYNCDFVTVQNISITNIYVPAVNEESTSSANGGIYIGESDGLGCTNITISNCLIHDVGDGISVGFGVNFTNILFTGCECYNCNWGMSASDVNSSAFLSGMIVSNCYLHDWIKWNAPDDSNHHNGFYGFTASGGELTNVVFVKNRIGGGFGGSYQTAGFYISGNVGGALVANNVFDSTDGTACGSALLLEGVNIDSFHYWEAILNNTFLGDAGANNTAVLVGGISNASYPPVNNPEYEISNNIFSGVYTAVGLDFYAGTYTVGEDYDLIYGITSGTIWKAGTDGSMAANTTAEWQDLGYELHLVSGNPSLNSSYQPQVGSAAIGAGANLSSAFPLYTALNFGPTIGAYLLSMPQIIATSSAVMTIIANPSAPTTWIVH